MSKRTSKNKSKPRGKQEKPCLKKMKIIHKKVFGKKHMKDGIEAVALYSDTDRKDVVKLLDEAVLAFQKALLNLSPEKRPKNVMCIDKQR